MKNRIASFLLAIVMLVVSATQVLALDLDDAPEQELGSETEIENGTDTEPEPAPESEPDLAAETEAEDETDTQPDFYLNGVQLTGVTSENINYTNYVTLQSIVPLIDAGAVLSEANGVCWVSAWAFAVVEQGSEEAAEAAVELLDSLTVYAAVGMPYVIANGRYLYVGDCVASINGLVAIPVRLVAKIFGLGLGYDKQSNAIFFTGPLTPGFLADAAEFYDPDDVYWLSRIIHRESGNQVLSGKLAVGNVVLNRVSDPKFPDTICDVIFQKNQFCSMSTLVKVNPNDESIIAAMMALDGGTALDGVLFFNRAGLSCYASKNRPFVATIGGHSFYA